MIWGLNISVYFIMHLITDLCPVVSEAPFLASLSHFLLGRALAEILFSKIILPRSKNGYLPIKYKDAMTGYAEMKNQV